MPKLKHLQPYHKKALELKYKGVLYRDMAEMLNEISSKSGITKKFKEQSVKDWFKASGTLCEAYQLYETEMDEIQRETAEVIKKAGVRIRMENFRLANEMLVALMGSENDHVKLGAIKELLDRVEGQPSQSINVNDDNPTYEQIIRELAREKEEYEKNNH